MNCGIDKELGQYYTSPILAEYFLSKIKEILPYDNYDILLEPSAGTGSFYNLLDVNRRIGLDLEPKAQGVETMNFYDYCPPITYLNTKILTVGNPPFGKNSSEAVRFFNHAAPFSSAIAFVLPRTFRKASLINRLNNNYHLIFDETVPDGSFIYRDKPYDVWCCMQIWIKKETKRDKISIKSLKDVIDYFEIVDPSSADFCVQRVGVRAGLVRFQPGFKDFSSQSHYFIKAHHAQTMDIFKILNYDELKYNTAGNPSISPSELVTLFLAEATARNLKTKRSE